MPDEELEKILERIFNKEEEEKKKMKYLVTIIQDSNVIELTADSNYVVDHIVEFVNDINKNTDANLTFRMDPVKED